VFRYESFTTDPDRGLLTCEYSVAGRSFTERITLTPSATWLTPQAQAAARLVFLLAGVSYYKTAAPPVIDLGDHAVTDAERDFLRSFYLNGLGEFAYRNNLDLSDLRIEGPTAASGGAEGSVGAPPGGYGGAGGLPRGGMGGEELPMSRGGLGGIVPPEGNRALVPFGGGIDSIVSVEMMRGKADLSLFVVSRPGALFDAIEKPAAVSGLPVVRAGREIDPQLLRSKELGFLNGHVPVTGIISAIAVLAAVLDGRDAVVMSNEWSASVPTLEHDGKPVNHQWSKGAAFEEAFRGILAAHGLPEYFSALRDRTELWIADRFARLTQYHSTFRSCNRAFHIDTKRRLDHWCGECDKCCFIDLILAPFMSPGELSAVFGADGGGPEPLTRPDLAPKFRTLLGSGTKPFECVGEVNECRAAVVLASSRTDRAGSPLLQELAAEITGRPDAPTQAEIEAMRKPVGRNFVPEAYSLQDTAA
jgi:UDP-N-acetyl-alpha-D-muramoyl-L-alanyl-L-glutamate epimerase